MLGGEVIPVFVVMETGQPASRLYAKSSASLLCGKTRLASDQLDNGPRNFETFHENKFSFLCGKYEIYAEPC